MLTAIAVVTAFVAALCTDLTDGWSWIVAPIAAFGIVLISDLRRAARPKTIALDAVKFGALLFMILPFALVVVVLLIWAIPS